MRGVAQQPQNKDKPSYFYDWDRGMFSKGVRSVFICTGLATQLRPVLHISKTNDITRYLLLVKIRFDHDGID